MATSLLPSSATGRASMVLALQTLETHPSAQAMGAMRSGIPREAGARLATLRESEFRQGWPVVLSAALGIGLGLSPVPFYTIGMFAPELARTFHWSFAEVQAAIPIMVVAVIIASPMVGWLADRFGVRPVALISMTLFGVSFMAFGLGNGSLPLFYLNWIVMALFGAGTLPITWTRAVNNRFEVHKGLALGLSLLGTGVFGFAVKPFTAYLILHHGWRAAYFAVGSLPLLIALPVAVLAFRDIEPARTHSRARRDADAARRSATPGLTFLQAVREWRLWVLAAAFVPISFAIGGPIPNIENLLSRAGFSGTQVVALASLLGLSVIVGRVAGGWLMDRFWAPAVAFVLLGAPAMGCWLLGRTDLDYTTAAASILLIGLAAGVEYDVMAFLVSRYFGLKSYGAIYGTLYAFFGLGAGLGSVVFGATFDRTHSYSGVLAPSAVVLVIGAAMLLTLGRYRRFDASGREEIVTGSKIVPV